MRPRFGVLCLRQQTAISLQTFSGFIFGCVNTATKFHQILVRTAEPASIAPTACVQVKSEAGAVRLQMEVATNDNWLHSCGFRARTINISLTDWCVWTVVGCISLWASWFIDPYGWHFDAVLKEQEWQPFSVVGGLAQISPTQTRM